MPLQFPKQARHQTEQKKLQALALLARMQAEVAACCDPRDLAEGLGLIVRPSKASHASIVDGVLRFPSRAKLEERGEQIFRLLSMFILGRDASEQEVASLTIELALPMDWARTAKIAELSALQPHFPVEQLESACLMARGSGTRPKVPGSSIGYKKS